MVIFLVTLSVFALAMMGMAVGVILDRKPIQGSCGGIGNRTDCDDSQRAGCEYCGDGDAVEEVSP